MWAALKSTQYTDDVLLWAAFIYLGSYDGRLSSDMCTRRQQTFRDFVSISKYNRFFFLNLVSFVTSWLAAFHISHFSRFLFFVLNIKRSAYMFRYIPHWFDWIRIYSLRIQITWQVSNESICFLSHFVHRLFILIRDILNATLLLLRNLHTWAATRDCQLSFVSKTIYENKQSAEIDSAKDKKEFHVHNNWQLHHPPILICILYDMKAINF